MKAKLKPDKGIQDSEKMNKIRINKTVSMYYISWLGKSRRFELCYLYIDQTPNQSDNTDLYIYVFN